MFKLVSLIFHQKGWKHEHCFSTVFILKKDQAYAILGREILAHHDNFLKLSIYTFKKVMNDSIDHRQRQQHIIIYPGGFFFMIFEDILFL